MMLPDFYLMVLWSSILKCAIEILIICDFQDNQQIVDHKIRSYKFNSEHVCTFIKDVHAFRRLSLMYLFESKLCHSCRKWHCHVRSIHWDDNVLL